MIPNSQFAVTSYQVSQLPIQLSQIEGLGNADIAAGTYLQLHDSCIAPAANAVPLWELPVSASTQFQETLQIANCHLTEGCFLGLSTTAGTYTAAATHMDITVWTTMPVTATNVIGDKTTGVSNRQIWANNVTSKRLYGLIVKELLGATGYVYINAISINDTAVPNQLETSIGLIYKLSPNETKKFYFGYGEGKGSGLVPYFNDVNAVVTGGAVNTLYTGCSVIVGSSVAQIGSAPTVSLGAAAVLAITN